MPCRFHSTGRSEHGLTYLVSYTWSKSLDLGCSGWYGVEGCSIQNPYNIRADKGPSATDVPQIFSAAFVYELPFGKGKRWSAGNSIADYIIGGWNINGVLSFNSGTPFDVGTGKDIANTGNYNYGNGYGYERADVVGPLYPSNKNDVGMVQHVFVRAAGPVHIRRPWPRHSALGLVQATSISPFSRNFQSQKASDSNSGSRCLTPRIRRVWSTPITSLDSPNFGQVTSTANTAASDSVRLEVLLLTREARRSGAGATCSRYRELEFKDRRC